MRIALSYSGYMRTWDQCRVNHWENLHLPNGTENVCAFFFTDRRPWEEGKWDYYFHHTQLPKTHWYPDSFAEHPYATNKSPEGSVYQTLRQWQGNFVAFSILPSDYDVYVRVRPDIKFNGPLKFQKPEPKTIYIPEGMDYRGINDQFAYGDYETMKTYFQVFENYHLLWRDKGVMFNSEVMQKANLEDKGINVVRFGSPQHDLIR